jgi:alanine dehydrogenase
MEREAAMKIGIPKEVKIMEERVAVTPAGVRQLTAHGHVVYIEKGAGRGSGIPDDQYAGAGASILDTADSVWAQSEMIFKVKEPVNEEFDRMKEEQILFTYLHLAADQQLTKKLLEKRVTGIAYETIQENDGSLPLLAPMSEIAGRLSVQMGCYCLEAKNGGRGILLSGVTGVIPAKVCILGGGISGFNAARIAAGMGASVTILDVNLNRLRYIDDIFQSRVITLRSNIETIAECVSGADLVIGSVLIPGAKAPKLVTAELLSLMKPGSALVDIAIDQGGCAETSRPTTHTDPIYITRGVVHYCVTNMPGAVPRTSTYALTNATLPYALELADKGFDKALRDNLPLRRGLNVFKGQLTNKNVAEALGMKSVDLQFG